MEELISLHEVAKLLNLHPETLRRWDRQGKLQAIKVGSRNDRRYKKADIEKILSENQTQNTTDNILEPNSKYIPPNAKVHDDFEKAEEDRGKYGYLYFSDEAIDPLENTVVHSRAFILAEAGYGKSRLLLEAAKKMKQANEKAIVIDLKVFAQSGFTSLEEYIIYKNPSIKSDLKKNMLVCLDALDEIKASDFDATVDKIKDFVTAHPQLSILITCRWHFYKKRQQDFNSFDFSVVTLMPFGHEEILKFLDQNGITEKESEKIFDLLASKGRDLIIKTPRYLELLVQYIKEHGVNQATRLKRSDLFDYFIYQKLNLEDKRLNTQRRDMFKKVLERLALVMEIYQTNVISKEEFITFLEDVESASAKALINEDLLSIFYEKSLLVDNDKTIEFENTEFQEYLAAKHILTLRQPFHNLYDLVVEGKLREIHPSWFSTLSYLIEMEPSYLEPLLSFGKTNHAGLVEDEQYHILLTRFNLERITDEKKGGIFSHVFNYYQTVLNWVSYDVCRNLAYYYTPAINNALKVIAEKKSFISSTEKQVQLGNVALVVGAIMELGHFSKEQQSYWKDKLLEMIAMEGGNGVLQRHALYALEKYHDDSLIDKIISLQNHPEKLVREQVIDFCISVNPNHPTSINLFIKTLQETFLVGGYEGLQKLNTKASLMELMNLLLTDDALLKVFLDRDKDISNKHKSDKILINIEKNWDKELGDKLEAVIVFSFNSDAWHFADRSHFTVEASELIERKTPGFIFRLIEACHKSDELSRNLFYLRNIFLAILKKADVKNFIEKMSKFDHGKGVALGTLQQMNYSKREDAKEIFEEGKKFLEVEYKEYEKNSSTYAKVDSSREEKTYKEFKFKLQPEEGKFMQDVFDYFNHSEDTIKKYWSDADKKRLIDLVVGSVFEKFDPKGQKLVITSIHDGSKTYTMHSWIHIFGECIELVPKLGIDISKYRRKIVSYIPFAAYENLLSEILEMLGSLSSEEIEEVLLVYKNKESDLWKFNPRSLIEIAKKEKNKDAVDILKFFVDCEEFSIYERSEALETIDLLEENKEYFQGVFKKYKDTTKELAEMANKILVTKYNDKDSILWRFTEIEQRVQPFKEQEGVHSVGEFESELHSKHFAAPLVILKDSLYEQSFLNLLEKSFQLLATNNEYFSYVKYIWEIVYSYFDNRKVERSYRPLELLETFVANKGGTEGANWFVTRLKELRKSYLLYIGKPVSFADSIGVYNTVRQRAYLPIATNEDLYQKVKEIVNSRIREYMIAEGSAFVKVGETDIQKPLQTELKNCFLEEELKINILREPQAKDNTRCDYLIFYGWLGPILMELKLASHGDLKGENIQSKTSHKRLKQYLANYRAYKGLLLVIDNVKRSVRANPIPKQFEEVKQGYSDIPNVEVLWIKLDQ